MSSVTNMQKSNRLRTAFVDSKGPTFGIWQMLPGANVSRALARCDVDWVMVDCEHGNIDGRRLGGARPTLTLTLERPSLSGHVNARAAR